VLAAYNIALTHILVIAVPISYETVHDRFEIVVNSA
jgi:hypothetical protein